MAVRFQVRPEVLTSWKERRAKLAGMSGEEMPQELGWVWRMRLHLLGFLISRYGEVESKLDDVTAATTEEAEPVGEVIGKAPVAGSVCGASVCLAHRGRFLSQRLLRIADANRQRWYERFIEELGRREREAGLEGRLADAMLPMLLAWGEIIAPYRRRIRSPLVDAILWEVMDNLNAGCWRWMGRAMTQLGCLPEIRAEGLSEGEIIGILSVWGHEWGKEIVGRRCMSDSDLIFRPATNSDAIIIRNMVYEVLAEYGLAPDPGGTDADLADIEAHYRGRGGIFDVLIAPVGVIVGSVALDPREEGVAELRKMYLRRSMRGKGLGRLLLEHALKRAREMGVKRIVLETATVLKEAMVLYERYGFKTSSAEIHSRRCDCVMELDLEKDVCEET